MLAGFKLDDVKAALNPCYFQNVLPPFASSWKASRHSFLTLLLGVESIANGSIG